ncbi:hypothetical protein PR048_014218 [Dryococelus australis]|uniref:Transposase n=1 Tax=Dryococelus australis TaxID=614101 RepID=A0ABQ9HDR4_9NEOP|nr:hypothetical protein PR048_014218 [Dryococelus australis]
MTLDVVLLHDNAQLHSAAVTQQLLASFQWEVFDHPPYSPDLAPSDFHLFPVLKKWLRGWRFNTNDELQDTVTTWLNRQRQHSLRRVLQAGAPLRQVSQSAW